MIALDHHHHHQNRLSELYPLLHFLRLGGGFAANQASWTAALTAAHVAPLELLQRHLRPLLLRRTKACRGADGAPIVSLPPRTVRVVRLDFSAEERDFYTALHSRSRAQFEAYVAEGRALSQYTSVLGLILRLRQVITC